jgi:RNA polymerase sigma-70 factor (ECF subfamily)
VFSDSLRGHLVRVAASERSRVTLEDEVADLFEQMRDGIFRYVMTLGLNPAQAQDTTQEAFLRLYSAVKASEPIENRRAWVVRVSHNLALKIRARESTLPFDPAVEMLLADPATDPERTLLERERLIRFHRAVENLSDQQRRCLHLRMEGLRYPEIAEVLGISPSSVGEFLRRALARLRKVIHE